jgi:uncharacterized membrane protein YeiH
LATTVLLVLDLTGTFAFALNGALTALRATRLDIVGVVTLGMITALGGGTIRDVLLDALPPATFVDWRYLAVAAGGGLIAFVSGRHLERLTGPINALDALPPATFVDWRYLAVAAGGGLIAFVSGRHLERLTGPINALDAAGLSLFAVTGALKGLDLGFGAAQAILVGAITGVGGGTIRDVLIRRVPSVLSSGLYAIPALIGAAAVVLPRLAGASGAVLTMGAAALCFLIRMVGVRYDLNAPSPLAPPPPEPPDDD